MNRSKSVIVTMVAVGVLMALFAWWTRYQSSQRVLATWGPEAVVAIRKGERVELLHLSSGEDTSGEPISFELAPSQPGGPARRISLNVSNTIEISKTPGLIHARHHLLHERGFGWGLNEPNCESLWKSAIRFTHDKNVATLVLDFNCSRIYLVERGVEANMQPIASSLQKFLDDLPSS